MNHPPLDSAIETLPPEVNAESPEANADDWPKMLSDAGRGDEAALGKICERLQSYMRIIVTNQLGGGLRSKVSDSDIVQQSMLDVCRSFATFRGNSEQQCRSWIKQCVRRNIIDAARKYRGTQHRQLTRERAIESHVDCELSSSDSQTASRIMMKQETDAELLKAVARLPLQQRQVIEFRHRYGMPYAHIAIKLGISEVAARKCWSRAVSTLAKELTEHHES